MENTMADDFAVLGSLSGVTMGVVVMLVVL